MRAFAVSLQLVALTCVAFVFPSCGSGDTPTEGAQTPGFLRVSNEVQAGASEVETVRDSSAPSSTSAGAAAPVESAPTAPAAGVAIAGTDAATNEARGMAALEAHDFASASRQLSSALLAEFAEPEQDRARIARLAAALRHAQSDHRWSPKGEWPSFETKVQAGDSLIAIRKRILAAHPDMLLCTGQIERVNRLKNSTAIRPDDVLRIPTDRAAVIVDLSAMWILYTLSGEVADAWEVGVGKDGSDTKPGVYTIGLKQENPMWTPAGREPVPFGDPTNPLGTRWLAWHIDGRGTSLGFHGTNDASGIGRRVSEGCIRMRNEDVESLFDILPQGSEVRVQP